MEDKIIGPVLPPHLIKLQSSAGSDEKETDFEVNSNENNVKCLPTSKNTFSGSSESDIYGPVLPPHLRKQSEHSSNSKIVLGPSLPPVKGQNQQNSSSEDDGDIVGPPVPVGDGVSNELSLTQQRLEMRAQYLKRKMAEEELGGKKGDKRERESWMLELPPEKAANLGLGPRSFRKREGPDLRDRSEWTDTPADRMRKKMLGQDAVSSTVDNEEVLKAAAVSERDKVMEQMAESCRDEKRQLSLLEMHQKKMLKKQKKEKKKRGDKPPERRPFDRNIDLQANRFDEAQKKSIFKKAQLLDTRFSTGQSKYL